MPAQKLEDALACLRSAFPLTIFTLSNGVITGGGVTVAPGLIQGTSLQMVRVVGAALKAIEDQQAEAARKSAAEAGNGFG